MTVTVDIIDVGWYGDEPRYVARCRQHSGWRCEAPSYDELRGKLERSLKSYISRHLIFEYRGAWK